MQVQSTVVAIQNPAAVVAAASVPANTTVSQTAVSGVKKTSREVKQLNRVNLRTFIVRQNGKFVSVATQA